MCYGMPTSQLLLQGAIPLVARLVCTVRTTVSNSTRGSTETDLSNQICRGALVSDSNRLLLI